MSFSQALHKYQVLVSYLPISFKKLSHGYVLLQATDIAPIVQASFWNIPWTKQSATSSNLALKVEGDFISFWAQTY